MDRRRRRFSPSAEGLESRQLLSGAKRPTNIPAATVQQKASRIDKLPKYLQSLQPGRFIPSEIVTSLQNDLFLIVGKLDRPSTASLEAANRQYRSTIANASISREDAAGLRATFVAVLESANAPAQAVEALANDLDRLIQVDSTGRTPALLAANDHALILQTALGVGRPIRTPAAPTLSPADDTGPKGDRTTTVARPRLVGRYDPGTTIQLLDENNQVLGTAEVAANGQYNVAPVAPLTLGKHSLRVRAFDSLNNFSEPSRAVTINIKAPPVAKPKSATPRGPLSL